MTITYEIKDGHAIQFSQLIGREGATIEEATANIQAWAQEKFDPTYKEVIKNLVEVDAEVLAKAEELRALKEQKISEATTTKG